jgi:hypothetical protein
MNEFEALERELKSLTPRQPSAELTDRIEHGLGDAGNLAIRRLPEEIKSDRPSSSFSLIWLPWVGLGMVATLTIFFLGANLLDYGASINPEIDSDDIPFSPGLHAEDPESPIHGVSVAELEQQSGMPVGGWMPSFQERLIERIDEGVISRPGGLPARQVRMHYLDEILWQHPATKTRILSTNPRQEIILIDLDLY